MALLAMPADAQPQLAGSNDSEFMTALDAWLADDDETALAALARLAQDDNTAARILLGLIDKSPALQGPYLAHLPRAQRLTLLRQPGGLSGRSWLDAVADHPLVATWRALWEVNATPDVVVRFHALGEGRAAREAMITLAMRNHAALRQIDPEQADPDLLYLLWRARDDQGRRTIENMIPPTHPQRTLIGQRLDARDVDRWLATSTAAAPIAALCRAACPSDGEETCRGTAYRALGSYSALMTMGTPSDALVDQATFLQSPRGLASVLRRMLLATDLRGRRAMLNYVEMHSSCLADALRRDHNRYLPRLPDVPASE